MGQLFLRTDLKCSDPGHLQLVRMTYLLREFLASRRMATAWSGGVADHPKRCSLK